MQDAPYRTVPDTTDQMPAGIPYIVGNEAAERFSFYGMKGIITIFLTKHLVDASGASATMTDDQAKAAVALFIAAAYAMPLFGALLSDGLWGKYKTILRLSLLYCAGHAVLAMVDWPLGVEPLTVFTLGLVLIAIGAGGVKPCVTAHVGDQFGPSNQHHLPKVFSWFYFSINVGAVTSMLLTPLLLKHWGVAWAFGVPGLLMGVATFVFWKGRTKFVHIPPGGNHFVAEFFSAEGLKTIARISPLLLLLSVFWSLFDQTASAWVLQAEHLDRVLVEGIGFGTEGKIEATPSQLQAINPFLVLLMIPLFNGVLYPMIGRVFSLTPLRKIGIGFVLAACSFALAGAVESAIDAGHTPTYKWQVLMYTLLTAGEIFVSITSLEFFYTQAPRRMKSLIMACFFLSISLGNLLTWAVNNAIQLPGGESLLPGASYYWFFTAAMAVTTLLYFCWSPFYREKNYIQGDERD